MKPTLVLLAASLLTNTAAAAAKTIDVGTPYKPEKCEPTKRSDS